MDYKKIVEQILNITNESPYGRLDMDSVEAGEIWKLLNKELNQGQTLPIDIVVGTLPKCKHKNIDRQDGCDECLDCGVRNY
jgi:hypothetical protein